MRDELERSRRQHPDPETVVPSSYARQFNAALADVAGELGDDRVRAAHVGQEAMIPPSQRMGRRVETVPRDRVLSAVREVLRGLNAEGDG
jgi:hypothetical protein